MTRRAYLVPFSACQRHVPFLRSFCRDQVNSSAQEGGAKCEPCTATSQRPA